MEITALQPTFLKKSSAQSSVLQVDEKVAVEAGRSYQIVSHDEIEHDEEAGGEDDGHARVELDYGAGTWLIYDAHWKISGAPGLTTSSPAAAAPSWNSVNWNNFSAPVSKYFTVGEVTKYSHERIPVEESVKKNIIAVAGLMDEIREWWGGPLGVNSWNRPWAVNRRIGSRAPNHPMGYAVDFRPINGSIWTLQRRFDAEWYQTGRWSGGFGYGAPKGFIHVDLGNRRAWNY